MVGNFLKFLVLTAVLLAAGITAFSQSDASMASPSDRAKRGADEAQTKSISEMLYKQRLQKEKKEYEEMLKRGEEALRLSKELENAYEKTNSVSDQDKQKLEELEKVVTKIRKELGGGDADDEDKGVSAESKETRPSTPKEAFISLQTTTAKLVNELNKTSRFSISAIAIQSSNSVLRLVRFLRFKD